MASVEQVLDALHKKARSEQLEGMARFGITGDRRLGVSVPDMRVIAKECGKDHPLALGLWKTGIPEAMIVASMVDVPEQVTEGQMDDWVADFNSWDVCDQVCGNLFDKTPLAWGKIRLWSKREAEFEKRAAYALIAHLAWHDNEATDEDFVRQMPIIKAGADDERNYVKKGVSWALRNIGKRNPYLNRAALETADELLAMESKTAQWIARDTMRDITSKTTRRRFERMANK
jgi:3-methyladenine DNA glycosylase AlkD